MTKQKSVKGLFIYLLLGIIAFVPLYLKALSTLSTNPAQLEQAREMMGISGSPEMLALYFLNHCSCYRFFYCS